MTCLRCNGNENYKTLFFLGGGGKKKFGGGKKTNMTTHSLMFIMAFC